VVQLVALQQVLRQRGQSSLKVAQGEALQWGKAVPQTGPRQPGERGLTLNCGTDSLNRILRPNACLGEGFCCIYTFTPVLNLHFSLIPEYNNLNNSFFDVPFSSFDEWVPSTGSSKYSIVIYMLCVYPFFVAVILELDLHFTSEIAN